jgi:hypothetical protein
MKFWLDMNGLFLLMLTYRNEVLVRHEWTISTNLEQHLCISNDITFIANFQLYFSDGLVNISDSKSIFVYYLLWFILKHFSSNIN